MRYPIEEIFAKAKAGIPISRETAISLIQENLAFRGLLQQGVELMTEDPVQLRKIEVEATTQWKKKVKYLLEQET